MKGSVTNLNMDTAEAREVVKYPQKKSMTPKEIRKDMVQTLAEDPPSEATVETWAAQKMTLGPKPSTVDDEVDAIHRKALDDRHLDVQQRAKSLGRSSG